MIQSTDAIRVANVGPIHEQRFTLPPGGGILRFVGPNGAGKTQMIEAVDAALSGRGKLSNRDGTPRGEVEAFGARITVGKTRTTRTGELEVISLEGKLDISTLVDPGIKDQDSADAKRTKALVQLTNQPADPTLFYDLLGGQEQYDALVGSAVEGSNDEDLVTLAARIKRKLEEVARSEEQQAQTADANAAAARRTEPDLDLTAEHDSDKLQAAWERAFQNEARLIADDLSYREAVKAAERAELALEDAAATYTGPTVAEAMKAEDIATGLVERASEEVQRLEAELAAARESMAKACNLKAARIQARKAAEQHESTIASWKRQLARPEQTVTQEQLDAAQQAVIAAKQAVENGAVIRRALAAKENARVYQKQADDHRREAVRLRDAARATDNVLSDIVGRLGCPLRVEGGRLVTDHPKRGKGVPFSELSMGERYAIAVPIAIRAVGKGGVFTLKQEAFEGLDYANRKMINDLLRGTEVTMITAECSKDAPDDGLRSEVYEPTSGNGHLFDKQPTATEAGL